MRYKQPMVIAIALTLVIIAGILTSCSAPKSNSTSAGSSSTTTQINRKDTAAIVNGEPILKKELESAFEKSQETSKLYGMLGPSKQMALEGLIRDMVIIQEAEKQGIKVYNSDIDAFAKEQRESLLKRPKAEIEITQKTAEIYGHENIEAYLSSKEMRDHYRIRVTMLKLHKKLSDRAEKNKEPEVIFSKYLEKIIEMADVEILDPSLKGEKVKAKEK